MTRHATPILTTLLDTDAYKLHMQQAVFHRYPTVSVVAEFRCRGDDLLGLYADEINQQIAMMQSLTLSDDDAQYLASLPFFKPDYLAWLRQFRYDPSQVSVRNHQGKLDIRISGPWREVIMWEVPLLALISEVVHRNRAPGVTAADAVARLRTKLADFNQLTADLDMSRFKLMDFGSRRRFSREVHQAIVGELHASFPWLVGSSNYAIARQFDIAPVGTQAHEWFRCASADKPGAGKQPARRVAGLAR